MAPGRKPLQPCPRPRRRSRGEDKYKEPEARSTDGGSNPVGDGDFSGRIHRAPSSGASAHRQIPTRILPDERSTNLRAEAPYRCKGRIALEHERRSSGARCLGWSTRAHGATTALAAGGGTGTKPASPTCWSWRHPPSTGPAFVEVCPARRASERPLPWMLKGRLTHEPAREVELRLSPTSAPARMMNILEAEGGTKIAARLASPRPEAGGHRLG
jgi:hypothetical protein